MDIGIGHEIGPKIFFHLIYVCGPQKDRFSHPLSYTSIFVGGLHVGGHHQGRGFQASDNFCNKGHNSGVYEHFYMILFLAGQF